MYILIKTPKKKTILTTSLGTKPVAYGHFSREEAKTKIFNTFIQSFKYLRWSMLFIQKSKKNFHFFVIHKHTVKYIITLNIPKLL